MLPIVAILAGFAFGWFGGSLLRRAFDRRSLPPEHVPVALEDFDDQETHP